jgi:hypothetical protein
MQRAKMDGSRASSASPTTPKGLAVVLESQYGSPKLLTTVSSPGRSSKDPVENIGSIVRQAAQRYERRRG